MYTFLIILLVVACVLLVLAVLIQNAKGGGLSSAIAGVSNAQQLLGAVRSADLIEKITWYLALIIVVLTLLTDVFVDREANTTQNLKMQEQIENQVIVNPTNTPDANKFKQQNSNPNE